MQQKELKMLNESGKLKDVLAVNRGDHWNVTVTDKDGDFAIIRTARGGKREFKTLDAVSSMLEEVGIKSFSAC